jgi:2-oxoglutarate dehydrogenase complex dehydrogenase (E1) component-like enzyme
MEFGVTFFIDFGQFRNGNHNEGDEPFYTIVLYKIIAKHRNPGIFMEQLLVTEIVRSSLR